MKLGRTILVIALACVLFGQARSAGQTNAPDKSDWWSFNNRQSSGNTTSPKDPETGAHPIDLFILAKTRTREVATFPEADRRTPDSRLSFDLIGLPPTPEEITKFIADDRPNATKNWSINCSIQRPTVGFRGKSQPLFVRVWPE